MIPVLGVFQMIFCCLLWKILRFDENWTKIFWLHLIEFNLIVVWLYLLIQESFIENKRCMSLKVMSTITKANPLIITFRVVVRRKKRYYVGKIPKWRAPSPSIHTGNAPALPPSVRLSQSRRFWGLPLYFAANKRQQMFPLLLFQPSRALLC